MRVQLAVFLGVATTACSGSSDPTMVPDPAQPAPTASAQPPNPVRVVTPPVTSSPTNTVPARNPGGDLPQGSVAYKCDGGAQVQATYGNGTVAIRWNGRIHDLTIDPASSDQPLFRSASYQWRLDGKDGTLVERGREVATDCEPQ